MNFSPVVQNKRVIVTGGSSGIGLGIVMRLLGDGHVVHVFGRKPLEQWDCIARPSAEAAVYHCVDVTDFAAAGAVLSHATEQMGGLDVLVNNAGIMKFENAHEITEASVRSQIAVNLEAPIHLSAYAIKLMLQQESGGHILNVASVAGLKATPKLPVYSATKAALIHYTRSLAAEFAGRRIRANVICPGAVQTALGSRVMFAMIQKNIPLGQLQTVEEVASLAAWLVSEDARNVTGSVYSLDGGMSL
jgi:NAD(P)-dependent dehydrogenase (short-subunit alcohol dehydrogenase family)